MKPSHFIRNRFVRFVAVIAILGTCTPVRAFDTSGHFEATRIALRQLGFAESAIDAVLIANFQTDYVVNQLGIQRNDSFNEVLAHYGANYFHFDDLGTRELVEREFAWLETATQEMAERFAAEGDAEKLLNLLGFVLHAVQDFYSHGSFADRDWALFTGLRIVTVADLGRDLWRADLESVFNSADRRGIFTGNAEASLHPAPPNAIAWPAHGSSARTCGANEPIVLCGQNHDSVLRRNHLTALLEAARSSRQVAEKLRTWIANDAMWAAMRSYSGSHVAACLSRAQQMAEAVGNGPIPVQKSKFEQGTSAANVLAQTSCSDAWEVRWSDNLVAFYEFVKPAKHQVPDWTRGSYPGSAPATKEWPSGEVFRLERGSFLTSGEFVGTYSLVWGNRAGTLVLQADTGESITGTLTMGQVTRTIAGNVEGHHLTFTARDGSNGDLRGELHLFTQTKDAMAGSIRDEAGRPDGAYALRR